MSELPDLPPAPRRTRPLPAGGLEGAMRAGRRRQVRFLGAAGGAATAVAVVAALVASSPTRSDDSLQYAGDPTPSASASPSPAPQPTPTLGPTPDASPAPASPAAAPAPAATPGDAQPEATPSASAPAAPVREDYVEEPVERDAPVDCQQVPNGSAGPIFYGSGTSCGSGSNSSDTVRHGHEVRATTDLCIAHGGSASELGWDTGREHEVLVFDGRGEVVYRFSATVRFPQGAHTRTLGGGRCLAWTGVWDATLTDGRPAPDGGYRMRVSIGPDTVDGSRMSTGGYYEFSVTVAG